MLRGYILPNRTERKLDKECDVIQRILTVPVPQKPYSPASDHVSNSSVETKRHFAAKENFEHVSFPDVGYSDSIEPEIVPQVHMSCAWSGMVS